MGGCFLLLEFLLVTRQLDSDQTLGAIATVVSAFVVFVLGGGLVLVSWVAAQETARAREQALLSVPIPVAEVPVEDTVVEEPTPVSKPIERPAPKRSVRSTRSAPAVRVEPIQVEEPVDVAPTPVATPINPDGRGTVIIRGDASRVRLIGGRGTFGTGALPSGSYTIQATFEGDDPRMAGTVEIADGERVQVVCSASLRRCERR
jgi:hypothetical protein